MASASTTVLEKAAPAALALMPDCPIPPHVSLVPFKLLPQCWSLEQVRLSKSVCSPLRGTSWDSRSPVSHSATSWLVFAAKSCGHFSSWHWGPGLEGLVCGTPHSSEGISTAETSLSVFICHMWMGGQLILHLHISYQS